MSQIRRLIARSLGRTGAGLDSVIPPEIKNDMFYRAIVRIAETPGLRHILEIGSSGGAGSTEAFVTGILANPDRPSLHCIEVSAPRYEALVKRYATIDFVHCHRVSSVPLEAFPTPDEVKSFHQSVDSKFSKFPLEQVLGWLAQDKEYVRRENMPASGIRLIREGLGIEFFDAVLIDGSEFTGNAELDEVYGARFVLLDDICTFKNYNNFRRLSEDPTYSLVESADRPRNGYGVFERVR